MKKAKLIRRNIFESTVTFAVDDSSDIESGEYVIMPKEEFEELSDEANYSKLLEPILKVHRPSISVQDVDDSRRCVVCGSKDVVQKCFPKCAHPNFGSEQYLCEKHKLKSEDIKTPWSNWSSFEDLPIVKIHPCKQNY